jgi:flagellar biosynthesis/type III secretory pathway protein FliH
VQEGPPFVPLALYLHPPAAPTERAPAGNVEPSAPNPAAAPVPNEVTDAIGAARRFSAGLRDALEAAVPELLQKIARGVLARELLLAQPDVRAIVTVALEEFAGENVLSMRVHPRDLEALRGLQPEPLGDETLQPGDVRFLLRSGTIDLTLSARLESVLVACSQ